MQRYHVDNVNAAKSADTRQRRIDKAIALFLDGKQRWERFGDGRVRPNKKIDTTLSSVLFDLLGQAPGSPTSLATRNLLRNLTMEVPSGQSIASAMSLPRSRQATCPTCSR
jgi:hypothetical protein